PVLLAVGGILAGMAIGAEIAFEPGASGPHARVVGRPAAQPQGAEPVRGGAAVGVIALAPGLVLAGHACLIAHRIIVDEEEAAVVQLRLAPLGVVLVVLAALDKDQRLADGRVIRPTAGGP